MKFEVLGSDEISRKQAKSVLSGLRLLVCVLRLNPALILADRKSQATIWF